MPFLSAHDLNFIEYDILTERMMERVIMFRDSRNLNETAFIRDLQGMDSTWFHLL